MVIPRSIGSYAQFIFTKYPVITLTGPRQSGKTTLVKALFAGKPYANLERPDQRAFAREDPRGFLHQFSDGAVIDEIQYAPDLLSYIQAIVDERRENGLFVLTGSQQFELMRGISQSLAGRTALLKLLPFSLEEMDGHFSFTSLDELFFKGFYPRIHDQAIPPTQGLGDYFSTYVERDLRQLIQVKDLSTFETFVRLCAGRVGQLLNLSSLASDAGISHTTARDWLNILEASYVLFRLPPFHANIKKRLVKSPKLYFYDIGLVSYLCGIEEVRQLGNYPLRGHFFENVVIVEALKFRWNQGRDANLHFYRDSSGNEVDLLYPLGPEVLPIEIKAGQTIASDFFKGLKAFEQVKGPFPDGAIVVYGGEEVQQRTGVKIVPLGEFTRVLFQSTPPHGGRRNS